MDNAYVSAIAALSGSTIGGLTSLLSAWLTQRRQDKAALRSQDRSRRRELYGQFIDEASKLYGDALVHNQAEVASLVGVYSLISQMRILSTPLVVMKAEEVVRSVVETYFGPNKGMPELRGLIESHALDPLRAFSDECRKELRVG